MAYGVIVSATHRQRPDHRRSIPPARRASPGVLLVLTHDNAPHQAPFQAQGEDRHARPSRSSTSDKVHYFGQPVALVVAETCEKRARRRRAVIVTYERTAGALALDFGQPRRLRPQEDQHRRASDSEVGDFDSAFAAAPVKIDAIYSTPFQNHARWSRTRSLAAWEDDKLTVHTSAADGRVRAQLVAETLMLAPDKVEVISDMSAAASAASCRSMPRPSWRRWPSRALARPVKIVLSRQQMFHVTAHRPATIQRVRLGAERDGRLTAIADQSLAHCARFDEFTEPIVSATRTLYAAPNRLTGHRLAALDLPVASAMRAPGEASACWPREAMDELATGSASIRSSCASATSPRRTPRRTCRSRPASWSPACARARGCSAGTSARRGRGRCATAAGWSAWAWPPPSAATSCCRPRPG